MHLADRRHWIFDLDGTLTVPVHDFAAIRAMLGLPDDIGILEALEAMPAEQSEPLIRELDEFEYELAARSEPADGAAELLAVLAGQGTSLGIVTRNCLRNVECTLCAIGLERYFAVDTLITREIGRPKPAPDGIHRLLEGWQADSATAVMVGNHLVDLEAGRAAGTTTVLVGAPEEPGWADLADTSVESLHDVLKLVGNGSLSRRG